MTLPATFGPRAPLVAAALLAAALTAAIGVIAGGVGERSHLINDDASTRFVAATFASGHLVIPAPPEGPAFRPPLVLTRGGKWIGKEYPALPLLLAPAVRVGADWLVNPVLAGLLVLATYLLGQAFCGPRAGLVAACFVALSPALLVLASSYLNTVLSATLLTFAAFAWLTAARRDSSRWALFGGFLYGAAFATKPYTAAWMLLPLATIPLVRWRADRRAGMTLAGRLALGGAPWIVAMVLWNILVSGHPLVTPYQLFEPANRPGFHDVLIAGQRYTPAVAWRDTGRQVVELADAFLPVPWLGRAFLILAPFAGWWALRRRAIPLLLTPIALIVGHFFFFGIRTGSWGLVGSRYFFEASPALALLLAGPLVELTRRFPPGPLLAALFAVTLAVGAGKTVPQVASWVRSRHDDPVSGTSRALERFVRTLGPDERRLLFVDISTYNQGSALLVNRPDLSGPSLVAVYREPAQNRAVMNAYPGRASYLVRWLRSESRFEMTGYVPEEDPTGPPPGFPYDDLRRRGYLRKDVGAAPPAD